YVGPNSFTRRKLMNHQSRSSHHARNHAHKTAIFERHPCIARFALVFILLLTSAQASTADVIFDSFNGPDTAGGTSAGNGDFMQGTALQDVTINNIAVLNRMLETGVAKFEIYSATTRALLLETVGVTLPKDTTTSLTWKTSPDFTFTLMTGNSYV